MKTISCVTACFMIVSAIRSQDPKFDTPATKAPDDKTMELININLSSQSPNLDILMVTDALLSSYAKNKWLRPLNDLWDKHKGEFDLGDDAVGRCTQYLEAGPGASNGFAARPQSLEFAFEVVELALRHGASLCQRPQPSQFVFGHRQQLFDLADLFEDRGAVGDRQIWLDLDENIALAHRLSDARDRCVALDVELLTSGRRLADADLAGGVDAKAFRQRPACSTRE